MFFKTKFLYGRKIFKIGRSSKLIPSWKRNIQNTTLFKTNSKLYGRDLFKIQRFLKLVPSWKRLYSKYDPF